MRDLLVGLCCMAWFSALAQGCPFYQRIVFPGAQASCISEFAKLARYQVAGRGVVVDLMDPKGTLAIAASRGPGCPVRVGLGTTPGISPSGQMEQRHVAERAERAMAACAAEVRGLPQCTCEVVVKDGESMLPRAEFTAWFADGVQQLAAAAPARPAPVDAAPAAPAVSAAPASVPAVAPASPPPQAAPTGRAQDLAELKKELDELRRQVSGSTQPAPAATRREKIPARALVIGNGAYRNFGRLANPVNDARAMADKLRSFGIDVDLVLDADRDGLVKALNDHATRSAGAEINILYYAGHGVQAEGINYLVPTNMSASGVTVGYLKLNGISLNAALDYMPAPTRVVFLDACRDNPVSRSLSGTRSGGSAGLAPVAAASGTLIAYATRDGAVAEDGVGRHSPYTAALLEHLEKPLDIGVVLRHVRQSVKRATSDRQEPWEYGSLVGDQLILSRLYRP